MSTPTEVRPRAGDDPLRALQRPLQENLGAALLVLASFLILGILLSLIVFTAVAVPVL